MSRLQKKALCLITDAFRTTVLSVLEVETHILPIPLQLLQATVNTALRIKGTPTFRRIQENYRRARLSICQDRLSPLQRIEIQADRLLGKFKLEEKVTSITPPW